MAEADPRTVFVAENVKVADAVIQLLASNNIPAELLPVAPAQEGGLFGSTETVPAEEFPIIVTNEKQANDARELLSLAVNKAMVESVRQKRANRTGTVSATCEDCGKPSEWPASAMGTTEICPHCGGYMDVPDPDENWDDMDFGAEDDDEPEDDKAKE